MISPPAWPICSSGSRPSGGGFDVAETEKQIAALEAQTQAADFWDDPQHAQSVMREIAERRDEVDTWRGIRQRIDDAAELWALTEGEDDEASRQELAIETAALEKELADLEFHLLLAGEYDRNNAILSIHAGAGGTEAQDWASMLLRMYLRWAERHRFKADIVDQRDGEEAGILSAQVEISGPWAYGYLKAERGVHRLVRMSPFNAGNTRETSVARVEVYPNIQDSDIDIEINPGDLEIDTYRSQGAGGQNVQKNESAVRIRHIRSGIIVTCQDQRSQTQNRERAMHILKVRLQEIEERKREAELRQLRGEYVDAQFGNQIRNYVLHPYQLVKDARTGYE
ncbi:MAG: peptide chain release factor 2, partial [Anaerolineae bacterium]|nr:peptide chain release factor 2 [Anaerolineae bacterium]